MNKHPGLEPLLPLINHTCDGCGLCVIVCPRHALGLVDQKAVVVSPAKCDYYGYCEAVCPRQAITRLFQIEYPDDEMDIPQSS